MENGQMVSTLPSARRGFNLDAAHQAENSTTTISRRRRAKVIGARLAMPTRSCGGCQTANPGLGLTCTTTPCMLLTATPPRSPLLILDPRGFRLRSSLA